MAEHAAELNAVIARWMGWQESIVKGWIAPIVPGQTWRRWQRQPPDYAGDLNVWNDVWPVIEGDFRRWEPFCDELMKCLPHFGGRRGALPKIAWLWLVETTARQRAEALGRVIEGGGE